MLYDNGQLASLYSCAFQVNHDPLYKRIVYATLEFVERELTARGCGFFFSPDADSEGEEGKFYVWTYDEIKKLLGNDASLFVDYYGITINGKFIFTFSIF